MSDVVTTPTEIFAISDVPGAGADRPAEERGTLDVRSRVVEQIAARASLDVAGIVTSSGSLLHRSSPSCPSASVDLRDTRAWITLDIAMTWPCSPDALSLAVQEHVRGEVERLGGVTVERLDVTSHVVAGSLTTQRRVA